TASGWSNKVIVSAGDSLEVRTTSSAFWGSTKTVELSLGDRVFTWDVVTRAPSPEVNNGYMVVTKLTYSGNLGGLAGANSLCLDELSRYGWLGKGNVVLDVSSVKAFLCDGATCQNPDPGVKYYFAKSGLFTRGGGFFIADGTGGGPGNDSDWAPPFSSYFSYPFFGANNNWWSGRKMGTETAWATTAHINHCVGWTSGTITNIGRTGNLGAAGSGRWSSADLSCDTELRIICLVTPRANPFGFDDVEGATANASYTDSAVVSGLASAQDASVVGDAELRNATTGSAWGATATVNNGDTVEVRMLSAANGHSAKTAIVTLGDSTTEWFVQTGDAAATTEFVLAPTAITTNGYYGDSVDISANVAVLGNFYGSGVFVFTWNGSAWIEQTRLIGTGKAGTFGRDGAAAVFGNVVVVGDRDNDTAGTNAGQVYVFEEVGTGWANASEIILTPAVPVASERLGTAVAIHGNTIAVVGSGKNIVIWENTGSGWASATEYRLTSTGPASGATGNAVAISGTTVVAGITGVNQIGHLEVVENVGSGWGSATQSSIVPSLLANNTGFGDEVAINGAENTIVTGAWARRGIDTASGASVAYVGGLFVYEKGTGWGTATETIIEAKVTRSGYALGHSVSIQGDVIAAGAPLAFGGGGAVFLITKGATWAASTQVLVLQYDQLDRESDIFGQQVSLCGDWMITGALQNDTDALDGGAGYIHDVSSLTGGGVPCDP
ncbi:MAG: hypothetical protein V3T05_11140, partial [Myxococcota bacterium]